MGEVYRAAGADGEFEQQIAVKLIKPGMAATLTKSGRRFLTPEYASPEQIRRQPVTTASDVYSLGVVLYQLSTGHVPYRFPSGALARGLS